MSTLSRRDFTRFLSFSGTAALVPGPGGARGFESFEAEGQQIVVTTSAANGTNPGLRAAPHFYNTMDDIDRFVGAIGKYMKNGAT